MGVNHGNETPPSPSVGTNYDGLGKIAGAGGNQMISEETRNMFMRGEESWMKQDTRSQGRENRRSGFRASRLNNTAQTSHLARGRVWSAPGCSGRR